MNPCTSSFQRRNQKKKNSSRDVKIRDMCLNLSFAVGSENTQNFSPFLPYFPILSRTLLEEQGSAFFLYTRRDRLDRE